ncbi:acetyl-CoA carboxylase biotin carboxylase subunit [Oceanobacillus damuensis]|uniref:acetyl-CoA carboxylase biotin carboxylase subunit n=1 Tax=Oceanobacillus damuensis TaxID=937928 RepID=UPI00082ED2A0|nr:biotin carboxylase N-terminal domain-containing protein [Oceanobacillus damuensis]
MFSKVLVVNRGAIAARIIRTLRKMDIFIVAIHSDPDSELPYLKEADEVYSLDGKTAVETYLNQGKILEIIDEAKVDAVHPGYGFLAENTGFAKKLEERNVTFIGPSSNYISLMSDKNDARTLMSKYDLPVGKGSAVLSQDLNDMKLEAEKVGYPVLVKPANGGGGIGMIPVYEEKELEKAVERARSMAEKFFSDGSVYLEKYFEQPRHIEFQIMADREGNVAHLYERDCSLQRRHQKIIEESPAPGIAREEIVGLGKKIQESVEKIGYDNIGTVEMLRSKNGDYSFLEMNTRLQVEHAVTEEIVDVDLVEAQIRSAANESLSAILPKKIEPSGHSLEVRIYAEDPYNFFPSPGTLETYQFPETEGIRIETGFKEGNVISSFYDPMIAKVIVHRESREQAIADLIEYLKEIKIEGLKTNLPFLIYALQSEEFQAGQVHTKLAEELAKRMKESSKLKS